MGDLNLDKMVTISDFIDLSSNFGKAGGWREGDGNYDNTVSVSDFIDLASNFGASLSAAPPVTPQAPAAEAPLLVDPLNDSVFVQDDHVKLKKQWRKLRHLPRRQAHHRRHEQKPLERRSRFGGVW